MSHIFFFHILKGANLLFYVISKLSIFRICSAGRKKQAILKMSPWALAGIFHTVDIAALLTK